MHQVGVFAKFWEAGRVKSRLAATEGDDRAAELYRSFLATTLLRLAAGTGHRVLAYTPYERREDFAQLAGPAWDLQPQAGGDLGDRIRDYFDSAFHNGFQKVLLVGSDSPTLPWELVGESLDLLDRHPVVLGPTSDGGYYLVGAAGRTPDIFDRIPWSTPDVWNETCQRLASRQLSCGVLRRWYDVDDRASLHRLRRELAHRSSSDDLLEPLRKIVSSTESQPLPSSATDRDDG